ncbi:hypothetical protein POJ06DRAFT_236477 [Lipomyces tetrasporus]|uniref:Uncharacterized protein n=1 Tax=Lipomyces tetrasporus TaxID=54092 RepID=A0AAD7QUM4_9ASCO|nr:uncharacterized protein POJ06DRAFT_236477 [Lipomyces tetrasporus]KAJ8101818.1 hypothetical protein POJ06DRAFT_236477 [Lipomyces tetrasporus]
MNDSRQRQAGCVRRPVIRNDHLGRDGNTYEEDMRACFAETDNLKYMITVYEADTDKVDVLQRQLLATVDPGEIEELQREIDTWTARCPSAGGTLKDRIRNLESRTWNDSTKNTQVLSVKSVFKDSLTRYQNAEAAFRHT